MPWASHTSEPRALPVPYAWAFEAVRHALPAAKVQPGLADPFNGIVRGNRSMSVMSWGEEIEVRVWATSPDTSALQIRSSSVFGLYDWGRNRRNATTIQTEVDRALATWTTTAPPATPPP